MKNEEYQIKMKGISGITHKLEGRLYENSFIVEVKNLSEVFSVYAFLIDVKKTKLKEYLNKNKPEIERILIKVHYQNASYKRHDIARGYKNVLEKTELKDIIEIYEKEELGLRKIKLQTSLFNAFLKLINKFF